MKLENIIKSVKNFARAGLLAAALGSCHGDSAVNRPPVVNQIDNQQVQADCYEAMFNALFNQSFVVGIYPWMCYYNPYLDVNKFDFVNKRAEGVISDYYHRVQ